METNKFTCIYPLTISDNNCYDKITISGILNIFQDIGSRHVNEIKSGYLDLIKEGITWILLRSRFDIIKYPDYMSNVKVVTWQSYKGKADFEREYAIYDMNDNLLITGISKWCLINIATRRILATSILDKDITYQRVNYKTSLDKLAFANTKFDKTTTITITPSLVDHNFHVNNAKYGDLIWDHLDLAINEEIKSFEINYLKETMKDTQFKLYSKKDKQDIYLEGYNDLGLSIKCKIILNN